MTTKQTSSTYALRERTARAIEAGHEYIFAGLVVAQLKIGYVAGGGFVRLELRVDGQLIQTTTKPSTERDVVVAQFVNCATTIATQYDCGTSADRALVAAVALVEARIPAFGEIDSDDVRTIREMRELRREMLALLDHTV